MKLVSYYNSTDEQDHLAITHDDAVYDVQDLDWRLPGNMQLFLYAWDDIIETALEYDRLIKEGAVKHVRPKSLKEMRILAPVPQPTSCRDAYAFRQHVEAARRNRKVEMIPEYDKYPVFYFTNHLSIKGPGQITCMPDHFQKLDFELEVAIVI